MRPISIMIMTAFAALTIFVFSCFFTIKEGEHGILLRLGKLVPGATAKEVKTLGPGLQFKLPIIETVRTFDTRLQTLTIQSSRIVTKEKKDVMVDYYVKWRIQNIAEYYKSTGGNELKAESLLEQQLNTNLRAAFGKRTISELVSGGRDNIMEVLRNNAEEQAKALGVHVVDVRIKGIELPESTSNAIYQRMRADMQKIANKHRADGQAESAIIRANADASTSVALATAKSKGQVIRARGQAEAAKIYAEAYSKNAAFYQYYRSLKAYQGSFNGPQSTLVLDQNNAFFEYLKHPLRIKTTN